MTDLAHPATDYAVVERESPRIMERNLRVAAQLWASAIVFFFFAFLFAYFYLRALNQTHLWKPHGVDAPVATGTLVAALVVASAIVAWVGARRLGDGNEAAWRSAGLAALGLGVAALVVQVIQWSTIDFGPTDGGFASVFLGWTVLYAIFVLGSLYWLETLVATAFRHRGAGPSGHEPGAASGDPHRTGDDIALPLSLQPAGASAFAFQWAVLAGVGVVTWIVLYLL